jgi:glycosyltransferase involved in cell wall biosynthesis
VHLTDRSTHTDPVRLLYVGRIIRTKGLRDVIRAMALLRDLPVVLDVVGDGRDRLTCEATVRDLGLQDRVTFHGSVARSVVDGFYDRADIFVFPSYREPGGSVVLEAMGFGLPLVVCDRGGPAANVDDTCAVRLPAVSPAQLAADCAAAMRKLVNDPALRRTMGIAAPEHAARRHLWSNRLDQMLRLYDQIGARPAT